MTFEIYTQNLRRSNNSTGALASCLLEISSYDTLEVNSMKASYKTIALSLVARTTNYLQHYLSEVRGIIFTTGEKIGPVAGFVLLGLLASWLLTTILRDTK